MADTARSAQKVLFLAGIIGAALAFREFYHAPGAAGRNYQTNPFWRFNPKKNETVCAPRNEPNLPHAGILAVGVELRGCRHGY